jgi:hypothetical protein
MNQVVFLGCHERQHSWGSHTGDLTKLEVGKIYEVEKVEADTQHTKVYLKGIEGSFNEVCFRKVCLYPGIGFTYTTNRLRKGDPPEYKITGEKEKEA